MILLNYKRKTLAIQFNYFPILVISRAKQTKKLQIAICKRNYIPLNWQQWQNDCHERPNGTEITNRTDCSNTVPEFKRTLYWLAIFQVRFLTYIATVHNIPHLSSLQFSFVSLEKRPYCCYEFRQKLR